MVAIVVVVSEIMIIVDIGLSIKDPQSNKNLLTLFLTFLLNKIGPVFYVVFGIIFNNMILIILIKGYQFFT